MVTVPIRGLGSSGIIPDQSEFDLDITSWSKGRNVRFRKGSVETYSIFKDGFPAATLDNSNAKIPVGGGVYRTPGGEAPFVVSKDYTITQVENNFTSDVTPDNWSLIESDLRVSTTFLGGVTYINRQDKVPLSRTPAEAKFNPLPSWTSTFRAGSLRAYKDFLIAVNISKDGQDYPGMFKWSDQTTYGNPPPNWDLTNPASLSGENVLNDATSGLIDAAVLGDSLLLYTETEIYRVDYTGDTRVFTNKKVSYGDGVIGLNCVVEANNRHYVFGANDIYVTDGIGAESLTSDRVKEFIYSTLDFDNLHKCHVSHDKENNEVIFAYPSILDDIEHTSTKDCDFGAVYNYVDNTWTFIELPGTVESIRVTTSAAIIWDEMNLTWDQMNSSWASLQGSTTRTLAMISAGFQQPNRPPRILFLDNPKVGRIAKPVPQDLNYIPYVERTGIDLDVLQAGIEGRKMIKKLLPQVVVNNDTVDFKITLGRAATSSSPIIWQEPKMFKPSTDYKVDTRNTGRYLALKFEVKPTEYFSLSGYDADIVRISGR